ncbi:MAG: hypothetical protein ACRD98_06505 [Nitrososphaera sp.]
MNAKAWMIDARLVLFNLMLLTCVPTFGYAQDLYQSVNVGTVPQAVSEMTEQAQAGFHPSGTLSWSFETSADRSLLNAGVLRENLMLLAQKEPKSEGKKPRAEAGKTRDKGSDASKKDDDDEDEDEEEEDEDDDDEDKGKTPATKGNKAPEKKKS